MSFQWFSWQVCSPKFEIHSCFLQILNHHFVKHQMADVQSLIWNDEPGQLNIPHIRLCAPWKKQTPTTKRSSSPHHDAHAESETSCSALWTAGARRNVMEWRTTMAWGGGSLTEMASHWIPLNPIGFLSKIHVGYLRICGVSIHIYIYIHMYPYIFDTSSCIPSYNCPNHWRKNIHYSKTWKILGRYPHQTH